jgi:hypothetical protein
LWTQRDSWAFLDLTVELTGVASPKSTARATTAEHDA